MIFTEKFLLKTGPKCLNSVIVFSFIFLYCLSVNGQIKFDRVGFPQPPLPGNLIDLPAVIFSKNTFSDINNDGNLDLLIAGRNGYNQPITELYINEGSGDFTKLNTPDFHGLYTDNAHFFDIDLDGDLDLLINGNKVAFNGDTSYLFKNDGQGNFIFSSDSIFGDFKSRIAFVGDLNLDGNEDVFLCGKDSSGESRVSLFLTTSNGEPELVETNIHGFNPDQLNLIDYDLDGDLDYFGVGINSEGEFVHYLFNNNGLQNWQRQVEFERDAPRSPVQRFSDFDNDGDQDYFCMGRDLSSNPDTTVMVVFENLGDGSFVPALEGEIKGCDRGDFRFMDYQGDGLEDLIIIGSHETGGSSTMYTNNGNGSFSLFDGTIPPHFDGAQIVNFDLDNNSTIDIILSGSVELDRKTLAYLNDGSGNFSPVLNSQLEACKPNDVFIGDFNNDEYIDLFISGGYLSSTRDKLYKGNSEEFNFEIASPISINQSYEQQTGYGDLNNDGTLDLFYSGTNSLNCVFLNNGNADFTPKTFSDFISLRFGDTALEDLNGDDQLDVVSTGKDEFGVKMTKIFINQGDGDFKDLFTFKGTTDGVLKIKDVNGDSSPDIFLMGESNGYMISELFLNDGTGVFSKKSGTPFIGLWHGDAEFADVDGDSDFDLFISGSKDLQGNYSSDLFINDGNGNFEKFPVQPFIGVDYSSCVFFDVEGDGDPDILLSGGVTNNGSNPNFGETRLYLNNGIGVYFEDEIPNMKAVIDGEVQAGDINLDGLEDIICSGFDAHGSLYTELYKNDSKPCPGQHLELLNFTNNLCYFQNVTASISSSVIGVQYAIYNPNYKRVSDYFDGSGDTLTLNTPDTITLFGKYYVQGESLVNENCKQVVDKQFEVHPNEAYLVDTLVFSCSNFHFQGENFNETGTYTITVENEANCDSIYLLTLSVGEINNEVEQNENTLTAQQNFANYQWLDCNSNYAPIPGATNQSFEPQNDGEYAVLIQGSDCSDTSACFSFIKGGIHAFLEMEQVVVYPNPIQSQVNIDCLQCSGLKEIRIYDTLGKQLFSQTTNNQHLNIDMRDWDPGVFLISIRTNDSQIRKKVVKN